jgi:signal peptidase I
VDFALILFVLSVVSGVLWCYDVFSARKRRATVFQAALLQAIEAKRRGEPGTAELLLTELGIRQADARAMLSDSADATLAKPSMRLPDPWWVEYGASFFPVILPIFLLRSFWIEPFRIPSGSMIPTLLVGDFILVNKYSYGVRVPVLNKKIIEVGNPQRGDVMVFRYPHNKTQDYIKRVIGLPGDTLDYSNKRLTINGQAIPAKLAGDFLIPQSFEVFQQLEEDLGNGRKHMMLNSRDAQPLVLERMVIPHAFSSNCSYSGTGVKCTVPQGHYFVMGDNRDQSADSRVWGFVPDENIVGRAFFVWFHADRILPIPSGVSFGRVGSFN